MSVKRTQRTNRITEEDKRAGKMLGFLMNHHRISQQRMAKVFGSSFQQVQKYLNGVNRMSNSRVRMAAEYFEVPIRLLFEEAESADEIHDMLNRAILESQLLEIQDTLTVDEIDRLIDLARQVIDLRGINKKRKGRRGSGKGDTRRPKRTDTAGRDWFEPESPTLNRIVSSL